MQTSSVQFAPEGPFLFRSGIVNYRQVLQPWQKGFPGSGGMIASELWNYQGGKRLAILNRTDDFRFSPDGRRFVVSHYIGSARIGVEIHDTATQQLERVFKNAEATNPVFSPDGRRLLFVFGNPEDWKAGLFDVDSGREIQTWKIKKADWQQYALNPDGTLLAAGGEDRMIRLWDVPSGREVARWQGHDAGVTALLFSKDGQTLYSGSQDGTLKLWNLPYLRKELSALNLDW